MNNELKRLYIHRMTEYLEYWRIRVTALRNGEQKGLTEDWDNDLLSLYAKLEQLRLADIERFETLKFFLQTDFNDLTSSIGNYATVKSAIGR